MKKIIIILVGLALSFMLVGHDASARVDTISVMNSYNKSAKSTTTYIKNSDNKKTKSVKLELQKDGKTISKTTVSVKKDAQIKKVFKISSKGKYRIKYTVGGKSAYTGNFTY